jgi:hypothetical protein
MPTYSKGTIIGARMSVTSSAVGKAIKIIHRTAPISPQVTTTETVLLAVDSNGILRPRKQQRTQFFQDGVNKPVYRWEKSLNVQGDNVEKLLQCNVTNKIIKVTHSDPRSYDAPV